MTENLRLALSAGTPVIASKNDGTTFTWTPTSCSGNATCGINDNTTKYNANYYYSWYAATAETGTEAMAGDESADSSICPRGWQLPLAYTEDQQKSYGALTNSYNITMNGVHINEDFTSTLDNAPFDFVRIGFLRHIDGNINLWNNDSRGMLWLATSGTSSAYSRYFIYLSSVVSTQAGDGGKYNGMPVRCGAI